MRTIFRTTFETENFIATEAGNIPEGWTLDWKPGDKPGPVRPEIQPEYKDKGDKGIHDGNVGVKMCHAYSFFSGVLYRKFASTREALYEARIYTTAESGGGLACRIGIDPFGGTDFQHVGVVWSEWYGTDDARFESYRWEQKTTKAIALDDYVTVFLQCECRDAVQVNAGFFDDFELLTEDTVPPDPPDPGEGTLGELMAAHEATWTDLKAYVDTSAVRALVVG